MADFLATLSAAVLALTLAALLRLARAAGAGVSPTGLVLYFHCHHRAARFARQKIATEACTPFDRADWEAHVSASLEDANHGLIADLGFVGLMIFLVFEVLSGLG